MDLQKRYDELTAAIVQEHKDVFARMDMDTLGGFIDILKNANRIFVFGCGREGISLRGFAMRLAHMGKRTYWLWDDTTINIEPGDVFVCSEGHGYAGSFDYILKSAKKAGAKMVILTGDPDGQHCKELADFIVFLRSYAFLSERTDVVPTIQLMGAQYEQHLYMFLDVVIIMLMETLGLKPGDLQARHRNVE